MTLASTSTPNQWRIETTPWLTSMPSPSSVLAPGLGVAEKQCARRIGDDVGDDRFAFDGGKIGVDPALDIGIEADRRRVDENFVLAAGAIGLSQRTNSAFAGVLALISSASSSPRACRG